MFLSLFREYLSVTVFVVVYFDVSICALLCTAVLWLWHLHAWWCHNRHSILTNIHLVRSNLLQARLVKVWLHWVILLVIWLSFPILLLVMHLLKVMILVVILCIILVLMLLVLILLGMVFALFVVIKIIIVIESIWISLLIHLEALTLFNVSIRIEVVEYITV